MIQPINQIDFLIIGAQKCGTTALHKFLEETDCVYVPKEKEAPYFSRREVISEGWDTFYRDVFAAAPIDSFKGKATPQYMTSPDIPAQIYNEMPHVKLVAILRDPISRLKSQYKMLLRRGIVADDLEDLMQDFFAHPNSWDAARQRPAGPTHEKYCLVPWSEYGRILSNYLNYFPKSSFLILFQEDLDTRPEYVFSQLVRHIGLEDVTYPSSLREKIHVGGRGVRFATLRRFQKITVIQWIKNFLSPALRRKLKFWLDQFNNLPDDYEPDLSADSYGKLINHFNADIEQLTESFGISVPSTWGKSVERNL